MGELGVCDFCDPSNEMQERVIRESGTWQSIISNPTFRGNHALVMPRRHATEVGELMPDEVVAIWREVGRIASLIDVGFGYQVLQKFEPRKPDGSIKQSHLHFHVFPRLKDDGIFAIPEGNAESGFYWLDRSTAQKEASRLR